ncbi:Alpha-D-glucose-1-phosphate phosphatase YihX [Frondihabitans sp. 762G35]|nr:Alpha-D-glucose-1-phosphate phosphatase YihX [Frondihabitans sp. 762G35]
MLVERLRNVWSDAKKSFPAADWDLDPEVHRQAFVSTLSHDGAVPVDLARALYETMPNQWVLNDGAADFVRRASEAGIRLAIVSNIALDIRPALSGWGIASALDAVVLSYEVGYVKPDPRIFQRAADLLGTDPSECLMIGDSAHDDVGGAALGMQCLISRPDQMWRAFALASPE